MYVYVIAATPNGPSKVGVSVHPKKRLNDLQTANPTPLSLYYIEPIGSAAEAVERTVKRTLATKRTRQRGEWFEVPPDEAHAVVCVAAAAAGVLLDDSATLRDVEMKSVLLWLAKREERSATTDDAGEDYEDEFDDIEPPSTLDLLADTVQPPSAGRFTFNDYLLSREEGMWLRWAFERKGQRMPSGRHLKPYLEAANYIDYEGDLASRWIEWSAGRELRCDEASALAAIWDEFVPRHNLIERRGPQWATAGIDDHVDDVHIYVLSGDNKRGDRDRVVFSHRDFRAVLIPKRGVTLCSIDFGMMTELYPLGMVSVSGFVGPTMPPDIWERPFLPWLRTAPQWRDSTLTRFLDYPVKRYPEPRPYDGPQPATVVWVDLPCIDDYGTY